MLVHGWMVGVQSVPAYLNIVGGGEVGRKKEYNEKGRRRIRRKKRRMWYMERVVSRGRADNGRHIGGNRR